MQLILSGNQISDNGAIEMSDALFRANPPLSELDLSHNTIADIGAKAVAEYIPRAYKLSILKMQWNKIRADGGAAICEAVRDSRTMRNLDLSWNGIGAKRNGQIGEKLAEAANNPEMRHFDISYNSLCTADCLAFGEMLKENHSLYGLHVQGNECYLDAKGFVQVDLRHNTKRGRDDVISTHADDGKTL